MPKAKTCIAACLLPVVLLACSCGESQEPPTGLDKTIGGVKAGTPLAQAAADLGILADPTTYQPAQPPSGSAAAGDAVSDIDATAETSPGASANVAVEFLAGSISDGELVDALRVFNPEHVAALGDEQLDALYATFEALYETLLPELEDKFGADYASSLRAELRGELKCEIVDPENAQVAPNPAALLFGPVKELPYLAVVHRDGQWLFQLDVALTEDDAEAIVAYHNKLQEELEKVINWLYDTEDVTAERASELVRAALAGDTVDVGATGAEEPESADTTTDEPDENNANEEAPDEPDSEQPDADGEEDAA